MLHIEDLAVSFDGLDVLEEVSLSVEPGSIVAVIGPNGVGKSTLLRSVVGIIDPDDGRIHLEGRDLHQLSRRERASHVAYVPQSESPTFASTVFQSVLLGRTPHTSWRPSADDRKRVGEALERLGLTELATRRLDELSGGQRQKVRIARVLVQEPSVMVLDEPTASLDLRHRQEVLSLLRSAVKEADRVGLVAMHDLELAAQFADEVAVLSEGQVYDVGRPSAVLTPGTIERVYGVSASVERANGRLHIDAVEPSTRLQI
ncbi:MAG: ABC transporter ATP-binding protein [Halodesulfurarchaeum sp.]